MLWGGSNVVTFSNRRPVVFGELGQAGDELCFKEEKCTARTDADLVGLAYILARICAYSVDLFIQAEVSDLLLFCTTIGLYWHQIVMFQDRQLLVDQ